MKKIIAIAKGIRSHWKKSAFAAAVLSYGANYGANAYKTRQLMRKYCEEAAKYGEEPIPVNKSLRRITVILNPVACKRKSKELFEKYCAPLLHLAGVTVTVVQTEFAGQAKDLPEALDPLTDAIVIAGGDGTLLETVTGLLRRAEGNLKALQSLPIAALPLGRTSSIAKAIVGDGQDEVKNLAEATLSVIDGLRRQVDVIRIDPLEDGAKPIYSLGKLEWGAHRDVRANRDTFWVFGPWREYVGYLFTGSAHSEEWRSEYTEPCIGCLRCTPIDNSSRKWWQSFLPRTPPAPHLLVANERCGTVEEKIINTVELTISTNLVSPSQLESNVPHIKLEIGPEELGKVDLTLEGWNKLGGTKPKPEEITYVRQVKLSPSEKEGERWFSIDNEDFEVKPVLMTLLPKTVTMFEPRRDRKL